MESKKNLKAVESETVEIQTAKTRAPITKITEEQNLACINEIEFDRSYRAHVSVLEYINKQIKNWEGITGKKIDEDEFGYLIVKDTGALKIIFDEIVADRLGKTFSPSARAADKEHYAKDWRTFYYGLGAVSFMLEVRHYSLHRIRLENGKAVFTYADKEKLFIEKFSVNLATEEQRFLDVKLTTLINAYKSLYYFLVTNPELKIDPTREGLIGERGILYLHHDDNMLTVNEQVLYDRS